MRELSPKAFTLPRGMRDIDSKDMNRRLWLYDAIRGVVRRYGYQIVEPATIENLETLEAKSGPAIRDQIYWFKDKAGRNLGLRFDLTVGLARMVATRSDLPEPVKYATIGGNWRYEEPQFGRYRYFTQWDVEVFGSASPVADAEVICVGADILRAVGLKDFIIRISSRKLTEAYLKQLGVASGGTLDQCLRIIDKLRKAKREQLEQEFKALGINKDTIQEIFSFVSMEGAPEIVLAKLDGFSLEDESSKNGLDDLKVLADALSSSGRLSSCVYDLSIVRGIGYYDGIVFEAYDKGREDVGSIFGGGRYDRLCSAYGTRDIPATGVAGGIDRLMLSLERGNLFPDAKLGAKVFVATVQEKQGSVAIKLAQELRDSGVAAEIDLKTRPLGKQLEYADATKIPYVVIIGPQEMQAGKVKIREMSTRKEKEVAMEAVVAELQTLS